jgi:hypothetical protein
MIKLKKKYVEASTRDLNKSYEAWYSLGGEFEG